MSPPPVIATVFGLTIAAGLTGRVADGINFELEPALSARPDTYSARKAGVEI